MSTVRFQQGRDALIQQAWQPGRELRNENHKYQHDHHSRQMLETLLLAQFGLQDAVINEAFISNLCCAREGIERTVFSAFMNGCNTPKNLRELETLLNKQEHEMEATTIADEWVDAVYEFRFEEAVGRMTQNQIIANQQKQIHQLWSYAWAEIGCVPEKRVVLHLEHRLLFEAMRHGDLDRMFERITKHVNKSLLYRRT